MQKKLIALAVAGLASTGAFAQSNVTVYGIMDGSLDVIRVGSSTAGAPAGSGNVGTFTRASANSSYLGFKGSEALGNGLTAVFQLEGGADFPGGGAFAFSRDSFVGVASGFGTVVLGQLTGPTRALGAALDVNAGATGIGANAALLGKLGNNLVGGVDANTNFANAAPCGRSATCTSIFDTRWRNAIAYVSPSFAGVNVTAAYVNAENTTAQNLGGTAGQLRTQGYDVGVKYGAGPIMAAVTYNAVSLGNSTNTDVSDLRAGASYDFGVASLRVLFDRTKLETSGIGGGDLKQNVWGVGGTFNLTPAGKLVGQFYKANDLKGNLAPANAGQTGAKLYEVGYEHSLSKRTMLKATYAHLVNEDAANYDFGINATGVSAPGSTRQGLQLGVRHSF